MMGLLTEVGLIDVRITARFNCFHGTSKADVAEEYDRIAHDMANHWEPMALVLSEILLKRLKQLLSAAAAGPL